MPFQESLRAVHGLLTGFPVNQNPLEMRIAPLLYEQKTMLEHAISLLHQEFLDKKQFRNIVSIIYRNNEAFDPLFRAWIRASKWMESAQPETLRQKKWLSNQLRYNLTLAVPTIQQIYGKQEAKFIVPPLFRYEKKLLN